jgi:hypothetical protein
LDSIRDGIALTDCDMWIHRYKVNTDRVSTREVQHLMLVEVKTFSADVPDSQRDTYQIINAILRTADRRTWSIPTRDGKPKRYVRSWGVHVLRLSGACPATSDGILWDGKLILAEKLEKILRFEVNPDTLREHSDRRHHAPSVAIQQQLRLRRLR